MPAIAVTDHGNMFGAFDFWKTATEAGIKPIIGTEAYVTPGTHRSDKTRVRWGTPEQSDDDVSGSGAYTHMTLLSRDDRGHAQPLPAVVAGVASRATTSSRAWTASCCRPTAKGLIATTGCPSRRGADPPAARPVRRGARRRRPSSSDIFGKENFFAEIMDHGLGIERRIMNDLLRLAKELDLPLVGDQRPALHARSTTPPATRRCCACSPARPSTTRTASSSTPTSSTSRPPREMRQLFRDHPEACDNTLLIAERCEVEFNTERQLHAALPGARRARPRTPGSSRRSSAGLHERYPAGIPDDVRKQADYETGVILQMGFPGYFLVVADFINWAKQQRHPRRPRPWLRRRLDGGLRHGHHRPRPARSTA